MIICFVTLPFYVLWSCTFIFLTYFYPFYSCDFPKGLHSDHAEIENSRTFVCVNISNNVV